MGGCEGGRATRDGTDGATAAARVLLRLAREGTARLGGHRGTTAQAPPPPPLPPPTHHTCPRSLLPRTPAAGHLHHHHHPPTRG